MHGELLHVDNANDANLLPNKRGVLARPARFAGGGGDSDGLIMP